MQQQDEPESGELQQQPQATSIADTPQIVQRPDECAVCLLVYDELDRRPRCLPCGHTYCSSCVCVLLQDNHLICPSCRTHHCAPDVNQFPICYALEAMMRAQQVQAAPQATGEAPQATGDVPQVASKGSQATEAKSKRRATVGLSRKLRSIIEEQKESIKSLETTLQKELEQLKLYLVRLALSREEHAHLLKELDKLVQRHRANIGMLQEEEDRVKDFADDGEEAQKELRAAQGQLDQVSTAQEAFTTVDAADHTVMEVEEWLQHSREEIPNGNVLSFSFMMLEATKTTLDVITKEIETTPDHATSGHLKCTIMETVKSIRGGPVEFVDLRKEWFVAGRVFATQKNLDGTCYSSKIIWKENKVHVHALKKGSPPHRTFTLQVSRGLLKNLKYSSISVFLTLAWPGTSSQRVSIRLLGDTPLTRQFVTLCLGHTGLSYCNTNLLSVENYNNRKIVWGGDIIGQKPAVDQVLPPLHALLCGKKVGINTGMVVARTDLSDVAKRTQFGIVIGGVASFQDNPLLYCLGSVKSDGLGVVERAVDKSAGIISVKIVDCGIVY